MKNKGTILKLYKELVENSIKPTKKYYKILRRFGKYRNELVELVGQEQKIDKLLGLLIDTEEELKKQIFIEGYTLGTRLIIEAL